jgi:Xaa-Pro aminopeptidase
LFCPDLARRLQRPVSDGGWFLADVLMIPAAARRPRDPTEPPLSCRIARSDPASDTDLRHEEKQMHVELRRAALPEFGLPIEQPEVPESEFVERVESLRRVAGTDWVGVYGDREHAANPLWTTGFDPRFEEALLLIGRDRRLLLVGNEGMGHAVQARLPVEVVLCQSFSLMGQPRDDAPRLSEVLRTAGIRSGESVGLVGWKYLDGRETDRPDEPAFVPAMLVESLRSVGAAVRDVTSALMHPTEGLRALNSAAQIAAFEWSAARSSAAVLRVVRGARPGMTEYDAAALLAYAGEPLSCHPIVASGSGPINGLRSPTARRLEADDGITCGFGLWGALACRAGVLSDAVDEEFVERYVSPYFAAQVAWYETVGVGVTGDEVYRAVLAALADAPFRPLLNPGHLISFDEWVHSPIFAGSDLRLGSGMLLQCDIIPDRLPPGRALNCEDGIALADRTLRDRIAGDYPAVWARIEARRAFMGEVLGIRLAPDVLPLSSAPAYLPPFWLADDLVCTRT